MGNSSPPYTNGELMVSIQDIFTYSNTTKQLAIKCCVIHKISFGRCPIVTTDSLV